MAKETGFMPSEEMIPVPNAVPDSVPRARRDKGLTGSHVRLMLTVAVFFGGMAFLGARALDEQGRAAYEARATTPMVTIVSKGTEDTKAGIVGVVTARTGDGHVFTRNVPASTWDVVEVGQEVRNGAYGVPYDSNSTGPWFMGLLVALLAAGVTRAAIAGGDIRVKGRREREEPWESFAS